MKRLLEMLVLTPREQRVVVLIMLILVAGALVKRHRDSVLNDVPRASTPSSPSVTPTPNE